MTHGFSRDRIYDVYALNRLCWLSLYTSSLERSTVLLWNTDPGNEDELSGTPGVPVKGI